MVNTRLCTYLTKFHVNILPVTRMVISNMLYNGECVKFWANKKHQFHHDKTLLYIDM